jgi:hypothetical protein
LAGTGVASGVEQVRRGGLLAGGAGVLIVASVVPLSLLQLPNLMGLGLPPSVIARLAGQDGAAELVRAAGLALPVMACVAPVAAVLARRHRAWPALLAGLLLIGVADLLGNSVHSVLGVALDRALHGLGAGTALPASLALCWERPARWRGLLSRWWVAVAVISLLGSVPLMRDRLAGSDWRAALQPFPWLGAAALAATAIYVATTGGSGPPPRSAVTPAERTQLALLAVPLAGLGALDLGVSDQNAASVTAAAGVAVFILAGLALVTSADAVTGGTRGRLGFPLIGACAGFSLAPTAGAITVPRLLALPLAVAVISGATVAWLCGRRAAGAGDGQRARNATGNGRPGSHAARHKSPRKSTRKSIGQRIAAGSTAAGSTAAGSAAAGSTAAGSTAAGSTAAGRTTADSASRRCVLAGLACAAAGLIMAPAAGLTVVQTAAQTAAGPGHAGLAAAAAWVLLGGGVTMALSAGIAEATPAGAMAGLSLTLAGSLTGYLVAGAIQIRLVGSLARAVGWWEGAAAVTALVTAAGVFLLGRARRDREEVVVRG